MSKPDFKQLTMQEAIKSGDKDIFYQGMVFSYGQFLTILNMFAEKEDIKKVFLGMAKELDIPMEGPQGEDIK